MPVATNGRPKGTRPNILVICLPASLFHRSFHLPTAATGAGERILGSSEL
ncbi:MAG: hypothetical protein U0996_06780 [Planctomycetaceae bacterium]